MAITIHDYRFVYHKVGGHGANFEASDQDLASASYQYFGFLSSSGSWIIQRFDLTTPNVTAYRYAAGQSGYAAAWVGRADLTYKLFNEVTEI